MEIFIFVKIPIIYASWAYAKILMDGYFLVILIAE